MPSVLSEQLVQNETINQMIKLMKKLSTEFEIKIWLYDIKQDERTSWLQEVEKNCDVAITLEDVDRIVDKKGNWKAAGEQNRVEMNLRFKKN